MPLITRAFIKTGLVCLVAAFLAGVITAARALFPLPPPFAALTPIYFHLFMVGWILQLIMGIAYWMFPKYSRESPRGRAFLAWATYGLLNSGLVLRVIAEPARMASAHPFWGWSLALSALLQWLAGILFVVNTWPRVKGR